MLRELAPARPPDQKDSSALEPDPTADLIFLFRQVPPDRAHPLGWEVAGVIRLGGYLIFPFSDRLTIFRKSVARIMRNEMQRIGATGYNFVNMEEASAILNGTDGSPIGQIIRCQTDFSHVSFLDFK